MYPVSGRVSSLLSSPVDTPESCSPSLPQLAARAQLGDRNALETLLRRLADQLRPYLEHLIADSDDAEDVLQEVLLRVTKKLPTLREHAWVRAWAYRIATRDALRHLARSRRHALTSLEVANDVPVAEAEEDCLFDPLILAQLPSAVAGLPAKCQTVVRLRSLHGLTQAEIAEILSIPLGTVKSRIAYGLRLLRERIRKQDCTL